MGEKLQRTDLQTVQKAFRKVEMEIDTTKDVMARFVVDGVLVAKTKCSGGRGDLKDWELSAIKKQLYLDTAHFNDLVRCPLTREGMIAFYREKGIIKADVPKQSD